jgi:hypothetical protein
MNGIWGAVEAGDLDEVERLIGRTRACSTPLMDPMP